MAFKMATTEYLSVEAYLAQENDSPSHIRHELIDGQLRAMAGASKNHMRITQNFTFALLELLEGSPCEPFATDLKARVFDNFFYPDVMVVCDEDESESYYTESPTVIVEVLSKSTRKHDQKTKLMHYLNIPNLEEYILVEQDIADITVYRKHDDWRATHYFLGESFVLDSIKTELSVAEIYKRVHNADVLAYAAEQSATENSL